MTSECAVLSEIDPARFQVNTMRLADDPGFASGSTSQGLQALTRLADISEQLGQLNSRLVITLHGRVNLCEYNH